MTTCNYKNQRAIPILCMARHLYNEHFMIALVTMSSIKCVDIKMCITYANERYDFLFSYLFH
jgi:hypothetical protein